MSGLGDALQSVGQQMFGIAKEQRLAKLQKERDEKMAADELAKEERQAARARKKVQSNRTIQRDGQFVNQYLNDEGEVLKEEAADPYAVAKLNTAMEKDKVSLEGVVLGNKLKTKQVEAFDTDKALAREATMANIDQSRASATRSRTQSLESVVGEPQDRSIGALTNLLLEETDDLRAQYTKGDEPQLTADEYREVVTAVIKEAASNAEDPRVQLPKALRRYIQLKAKRAK